MTATLKGLASDRSSVARRRARKLNDANWIASIVRQSSELAESLRDAPASLFRRHTDRLRRDAAGDQGDTSERLILAAAAVIEAVRHCLGWRLFDVQLHAGVIASCGAVAEMQTGEGKTLAVILAAYFKSLSGGGVHVAVPNSYLAQRDFQKLAPVYDRLGISTGLLQDDLPDDRKRHAYRADVTYGPGHTFGFDYLRDQLTLQQTQSSSLGQKTLDRLQNKSQHDSLLQRGLHTAIIDEIDHVLIDDAVSPLVLSGADVDHSPDADIHRAAKRVIESMTLGIEFEIDSAGMIGLSPLGFDRIYDHRLMAEHPNLVRSWHEYVVLSIQAKHRFVRDEHYVVRDDAIQIVDVSTGRIYADRTWSGGLHQAIAAHEGLPIPNESAPQASITRQRFYRYYQSLAGMTGTATSCEVEFASVYGIPIVCSMDYKIRMKHR